MKKLCLVVFVTALAFGCSGPPASSETPVAGAGQPAVDMSPIEGAWRLTALADTNADGVVTERTPQQSLILFARDHYSVVYALGAEPFPYYADHRNPTDDELLARMKAMVVNAGTYEIEGSKLLLRPVVARGPNLVGGLVEYEVELSDDSLTLTWGRTVRADGLEDRGKAVFTLVRLR